MINMKIYKNPSVNNNNTTFDFELQVIQLSCGLQNFKVDQTKAEIAENAKFLIKSIGCEINGKWFYDDVPSILLHLFYADASSSSSSAAGASDHHDKDDFLKSVFWLDYILKLIQLYNQDPKSLKKEHFLLLESRFQDWAPLKPVEVYLFVFLFKLIGLNSTAAMNVSIISKDNDATISLPKLRNWLNEKVSANSKFVETLSSPLLLLDPVPAANENSNNKKQTAQKDNSEKKENKEKKKSSEKDFANPADNKIITAAAPINGKQVVKEGITIQLNHHEKQVLPQKGEKNVLITSALPYVNNVPHLGNIIGCVLSADVFARYCRLRGYNTLYICGTDEYGTATETKALEEKLTCQSLCDKYHKVHKACYEWFGIDFDYFGRTTTAAQTTIAQDIFKKCDKSGYLKEDIITQLYCEKHNSFLADRFVEGTCPHCKYPDARGDQCDGCGKLLNAIELINPRCKLDNAIPAIKDSKHMFLDLSKLQDDCGKWVDKSSSEGKWTSNGIHITHSWLKEGLKPRCITRDLKWGTPVPKEGFENKVFYVWFDAPIGYLSITANYTKYWEKWWKNPDDVKLYQFMGKDNVPFHSVIFPCSLMSTEESWTLVNHINTTEYLQYENAKFSKSRGIGVFGNNVMDSGVPVEVWRYYLFSVRPESNDSQFTWKGLITANNGELLANLGNFVNRVVKFVGAKYDYIVPTTIDLNNPEDKKLVQDIQELLKQYVDAMELSRIRLGLKLVMDISARGNLYLQESKLDNTLFNSMKPRCDQVVTMALNLSYLISALVYPFMPSTSDAILRQLNAPRRTLKNIQIQAWKADELRIGHVIGKPEYLFKRIDEKMEDQWRQKYGGGQQQKQADVSTTNGTAAASSSSKKSSKKSSKSSSSSSTLAQVPEGITKTPEMTDLESKIKEQGDKVRQLKTEKADGSTITEAVGTLLKLKEELTSLVTAASK